MLNLLKSFSFSSARKKENIKKGELTNYIQKSFFASQFHPLYLHYNTCPFLRFIESMTSRVLTEEVPSSRCLLHRMKNRSLCLCLPQREIGKRASGRFLSSTSAVSCRSTSSPGLLDPAHRTKTQTRSAIIQFLRRRYCGEG